ncbi:hypothetical protein ASD21_06165 [Caulobacter sp. Root1455]|uniref:DUF4328 domain-containing protein n=1 Tax=unclassified Caulobacter TaxID=2648921 RepID=UPI0006FA2E0A|nr:MULTISPECIES: DUF4328 domain-containing protein [unclassified Caulobacter]KQY29328.1 hypothetical protein ASD38_08200 [Caulobacter sp. Root487D2Y]KQY96085.1 hypothetical protein ASD21_06165 [Caulobacter sp. Root1455]
MTIIEAPRRLAGLVIAATWMFFAGRLLTFSLFGANLALLVGKPPEAFPYLAFAQVLKLSTNIALFTQAVAGVLALIWIYRASRNAQRLANYGLPMSAAWAVGWYFVPIAAIWKPFEGMEQLWKASTAGTAWRSVTTPALLRWWWGAWLAGGGVGGLLGVLKQVGIHDRALLTGMIMLGGLVVMAQCVLFNRIVRHVTDLQGRVTDTSVFD